MNVRQKAKKYKRMYNELLKKSIGFKIEQFKIDTWRVVTSFSREEYNYNITRDFVKRRIVDEFVNKLSNEFNKYITFQVEYDPRDNIYWVTGDLKVVDRTSY